MRKIVALAALALLAFAGSAAAQGQPAPGPLQGNIAFNTKSVGFILGVEWGSGRRTGWLSNLHLGARAIDGSDPSARAGFVMVGKTFKGLTDELLRWQTERFTELADGAEEWGGPQTGVVWVRPEQVVEIALDGVQRSTRYPGGVALRFARVVRYRDDKPPEEADTIDAVRALGAR